MNLLQKKMVTFNTMREIRPTVRFYLRIPMHKIVRNECRLRQKYNI